METINDIADRYVDEYASLHPIDATYMGVPGHDDRLDDFSAGGFAAKASWPGHRGGSDRRRAHR